MRFVSMMLLFCLPVVNSVTLFSARATAQTDVVISDEISTPEDSEQGPVGPDEDTENCEGCESSGPTEFFQIVESEGSFSLEPVAVSESSDAESLLASESMAEVASRSTGTVELRPQCTTKGTGRLSGKRKSCTTHWTSVSAPPGFIFNRDTVSEKWVSVNGSENRIDIQWDKFVEIVPGTGIKAPRVMRARVHARSPKCRGCRGWSHALITATYVKYK